MACILYTRCLVLNAIQARTTALIRHSRHSPSLEIVINIFGLTIFMLTKLRTCASPSIRVRPEKTSQSRRDFPFRIACTPPVATPSSPSSQPPHSPNYKRHPQGGRRGTVNDHHHSVITPTLRPTYIYRTTYTLAPSLPRSLVSSTEISFHIPKTPRKNKSKIESFWFYLHFQYVFSFI